MREAMNSAFALARMHGRNAATWNATGEFAASVRFDYEYSDEESR
ncbi:hypothetical protein [Burkholderia sp. WAC0059]|nr:hypothetical protein [Burkholderia sp. WAC0059]